MLTKVYLVTYSHQPHTSAEHCSACGCELTTKTHGYGGAPLYQNDREELICGACAESINASPTRPSAGSTHPREGETTNE